MAKSYGSQSNPGMYGPTTFIFDAGEIQRLNIDPQLKKTMINLYQNLSNMAIALNLKDTGYYVLEEFLNSQLYFKDPALSSSTPSTPVYRNVFRKVINFGALLDTDTKSVAHGIEIPAGYTGFSFTRIYAAATNPGNSYIPIPFASPTDTENIKIEVDNTFVMITTGSNRTAYTKCYVVLEYIKT